MTLQTRIRTFRIVLTALGMQTVVASFIPIYGAITLLRAGQDDPLSDASFVALLLGLLLALGGGYLVLRGIKYQGHPV